MNDKIVRLKCAVCGKPASGRQWWNRDKGFGICYKCVAEQEKTTSEELMALNYGKKGEHYNV